MEEEETEVDAGAVRQHAATAQGAEVIDFDGQMHRLRYDEIATRKRVYGHESLSMVTCAVDWSPR